MEILERLHLGASASGLHGSAAERLYMRNVCVCVSVKSELVCLTWALDENSTKTVAQQSNQVSF